MHLGIGSVYYYPLTQDAVSWFEFHFCSATTAQRILQQSLYKIQIIFRRKV